MKNGNPNRNNNFFIMPLINKTKHINKVKKLTLFNLENLVCIKEAKLLYSPKSS